MLEDVDTETLVQQRTGMALLALSAAFFGHSSLSWWSAVDVSLGLGSLAMTIVGLFG